MSSSSVVCGLARVSAFQVMTTTFVVSGFRPWILAEERPIRERIWAQVLPCLGLRHLRRSRQAAIRWQG